MTPQLQQAIKLLQLSNVELTEFVEQELERNPMLERDEGERRGDDRQEPAETGDAQGDGDDFESDNLDTIDFSAPEPAEISDAKELDADLDNTYTNDSVSDSGTPFDHGTYADTPVRGGSGFDMLAPDLEQTLSDTVSLRDHLMAQLGMEFTEPVDKVIGLHLIDLLDDAGYLTADLQAVADALGCPLDTVEAGLAKMQALDPPGIFARDLRECLALQLKDRDRLDPCMEAFLDNLDLLAKRDFTALANACGADADDVADMVMEIKSLNPKPATAFDNSVTQPITPDVLMRARSGGGWIIELNTDTLQRVLVNNSYYAHVSRHARSKKEKQYITEQHQSANWLVKSLHQRATTILKVATELVTQQEKFFTHGVQHLKPLVLRDIAEAIEMHESTVSRVTSNKYMATPRGIYELKYFFTSAIASTGGGDAHSAESVRHRIKSLIDAEPPKKILSDDKIVALLKADGVDIARRTVAKYREAMGIPSSVQRRREKASPG